MKKTLIINEKKCLRCGHKWTPRSTHPPQVCPACKSYRYEKPIVRFVGKVERE